MPSISAWVSLFLDGVLFDITFVFKPEVVAKEEVLSCRICMLTSFDSPGMAVLNPYKHLKEEFVSNLHGSSKLEIAVLSAVIPALVILRMFGSLAGLGNVQNADDTKDKTTIDKSGFWAALTLDFVFVVVPTLLCLTVLADHIYKITIVILFIMGVVLLSAQRLQLSQSNSSTSFRKPFLAYYRFVMMLVTCVTILAVDFTVFPRRYAKTETYGTGLMDLGVGSFVAANAMVSKQARSRSSGKSGSILRSLSPMLVLGFARLLLTKGVDYQVHAGEYGVHWNFFFTLAAVSLLTSIFHIPVAYCGVLGVGILAVYQFSLLCGLNSYLYSLERGPGLVSLNKEGIFSIFGYWSLYLLAVHLGQHFFLKPGSFIRSTTLSNKDAKWLNAAEIWLLDGVLWFVVILLDEFVERVSRRTCNMAYVMLVLAQNLEVIGFFALADVFFSSKLWLLSIFDDNLLFTFLTANILTGLVNISMNTIFVPPVPSLIILVAYMALLVATMAAFKVLNVRAKFW